MRKNGRKPDELRNIVITKNYISHPEGSVLVEFGNTKVICNATIENNVPRFLKGKNPEIEIIGLQPKEGAKIPGIRRWPEKYLPKIFESERVDRIIDIGQEDAENTMRALARQEGICSGVSSGGAVYAALELSRQLENAVIVAIICDRGDRYLSSGLFGT